MFCVKLFLVFGDDFDDVLCLDFNLDYVKGLVEFVLRGGIFLW